MDLSFTSQEMFLWREEYLSFLPDTKETKIIKDYFLSTPSEQMIKKGREQIFKEAVLHYFSQKETI